MSARICVNVAALAADSRRVQAQRDRDASRWRRRAGVVPGRAIRATKGPDPVAEPPSVGHPKDAKQP